MIIGHLYVVTQDAKPLTKTKIISQSQLTFNCPWYLLTILHFLHIDESAKIWVIIKCDYWSFVRCNTRCQAFVKTKTTIISQSELAFNLALICTYYFALFLDFFPNFFVLPSSVGMCVLHKNESAKVWILLANCNYGSFVLCM